MPQEPLPDARVDTLFAYFDLTRPELAPMRTAWDAGDRDAPPTPRWPTTPRAGSALEYWIDDG